MDALVIRCAVLAAAACSLGAGYRTPNFVVEAPNAHMAEQIGRAAEKYRAELAMDWLGKEMRNWAQPCMLNAQVGDHLGAGGATSFVFEHGEVFGWRMTIQGSLERILDSVLPHEVTHTVFATHFRQPLPRWADEGACTTVEHSSERAKQQRMLIDFLHTNRGIAFSRMFAMREYPRDVMPLYSQGYSLARFLIAQGGKRRIPQLYFRRAARRELAASDAGALRLRELAGTAKRLAVLGQAREPGDQRAAGHARPRGRCGAADREAFCAARWQANWPKPEPRPERRSGRAETAT